MPSSRASEEQHEQAPETTERDLNAELEQMEDRFKRALADLDNYRKRSAREFERLVGERGDALLRDWFDVVDGLDRALRGKPGDPLRDGLRAVLDQVESILERQGVHRIGAPGERFDPNRHDAVDVRETDQVADRSVVEVVRSGFARGDQVLRPAQVVVARAPQPQPQQQSES
jgi:molecular chaperone GrpE